MIIDLKTEKPRNLETDQRSSVFRFFRSRCSAGQSLVELLIASGLTVLILSALIGGLVAGRTDIANESDRLIAVGYAREAEEAVRSVRETGWSAIAVNGTYHPVVSGGIWNLAAENEEIDGFRRGLVISDSERDSSGVIVESGGTVDPSTKRVLIQISWGDDFSQSIRNVYYFTRHRNSTFFTHTTSAQFNDGTHNNTTANPTGDGVLTIKANSVVNSYEEPFSTAGSYTYNSSNIEFLDGFAQLKNQGTALAPATAIANSGFDSGSTGWTFDYFGNFIGQSGNWVSTGGNPGGYIDLDFGTSKNKLGGGYWYYPMTINAAAINATTTFQWRVFDYQGSTPQSIQVYAFVDADALEPALGEEIWSSGELTGTTAWSGTVTANTSSRLLEPGTYYLKLMVRVSTLPSSGAPPSGPFNIGFDNVQLIWGGNAISYLTTGPTIYPAASFSNTSVSEWNSFTETAEKNGGEIYYQISYNEGTDWMYWTGTAWATSTLSTHYNTATTINANIDVFPVWAQKITFKAFLVSNGTQLVRLDNISIGYTTGASQTYSEPFTTSGSYTFDPTKIEVTGGFGQLKATTTPQAGSTANPHFTTSSTGWTFGSFGFNISQTGSWVSTGGNPAGYIDINLPKSSNRTAGGYWYQAITPTANATGTLEFQWKVTAYDPSATSLTLYAFVDSDSSAPTIGNQVWSSGNQTGTTAWTGTTTIDIGHKISAGGTFYVKLAVQVVTAGGNKGPFTIGFDNSLLSWSANGISYPSDSPTIYPTASFSDTNITSWNSFVETATKNGGEIYYQLSDNDGSTWQYWNGLIWTPAVLSTDYNTAATVNANITTFSALADKITFKAFLSGDSSQQVKLDNISIAYTAGASAAAGNFISSTFDAGANVGFNRVTWSETTSANNQVTFQVAVNSDNTTFEFHGPDGTTSSYYSLTNGAIALVDASGRYLKYKIYMTTTLASDKPVVADVTVNYSP